MKLPGWCIVGQGRWASSRPSGISRSDRLILNVSKSTFDVYMRILARAWENEDFFLLYKMHGRYLA